MVNEAGSVGHQSRAMRLADSAMGPDSRGVFDSCASRFEDSQSAEAMRRARCRTED